MSAERDGRSSASGSTEGTLLFVFAVLVHIGLSIYALYGCIAQPHIDASAFMSLSFLGFLLAMSLVIKKQSSGLYLFEPFSIVTIVNSLVFFVVPVLQFVSGDVGIYGIDASRNCWLGTIVLSFSYCAFFACYELKAKKRRRGSKGHTFAGIRAVELDRKKAARWGLAFSVIFYCLAMLWLLSKGYSLGYILNPFSGSISADELTEGTSIFGIFSYCRFSALACWMVYYVYGKNKVVKTVIYLFVVEQIFFAGGRFILLVAIGAPIIFHYIKERKSPSVVGSIIVIALVLVIFAIIQATRGEISNGYGLSIAGKSWESMFELYLIELADYKQYYLLFDTVPDKHAYLLGFQMIIGSFALFIPRAIWLGKPDPAVHTIVALTLGSAAAANGMAYPTIGELYIEFGIPGCLIGMGLFGIICSGLRPLYDGEKTSMFRLIVYSIVSISLIQVIIRGYFPQNFAMFVFELVPLLIIYLLSRRRIQNGSICV